MPIKSGVRVTDSSNEEVLAPFGELCNSPPRCHAPPVAEEEVPAEAKRTRKTKVSPGPFAKKTQAAAKQKIASNATGLPKSKTPKKKAPSSTVSAQNPETPPIPPPAVLSDPTPNVPPVAEEEAPVEAKRAQIPETLHIPPPAVLSDPTPNVDDIDDDSEPLSALGRAWRRESILPTLRKTNTLKNARPNQEIRRTDLETASHMLD